MSLKLLLLLSMSRILTGIQSTGTPHLGNILGAIIPAIEESKKNKESYLFIADLHSLTQIKDSDQLKENTYSTAAAWLAFGLDTSNTIFYKQSDVPTTTELSWVLSSLFPYQRLTLAHSFKDKSSQLKDVNVGLFTYPMLMAADILLYDANVVPVGKDQLQHLEITRDVAIKFNNRFGETLVIPEALTNEETKYVIGTNGEKMSKSLGNFWTIRDIIQKVDPLVLRLALVNAHYRSPIDMNEQLLNDAQRNHDRILQVYEKALRMSSDGRRHQLPEPDLASPDPLAKSLGLLERLAEGFAQAMDDDFNSREGVAKVLAATKQLQYFMTLGSDDEDKRAIGTYAREWLEESAGNILGILPSPDVLLAEPVEDPRKAEIAEQVEALLSERSTARANKDWPRADEIRDKLNALGVVVTDTADGPVWDLQ